MGAMATNEEIGQRIGLTHSGVSRIRSGGRTPAMPTMLRIEQETGWTLEAQVRAAAEGKYADEFELHLAEGVEADARA